MSDTRDVPAALAHRIADALHVQRVRTGDSGRHDSAPPGASILVAQPSADAMDDAELMAEAAFSALRDAIEGGAERRAAFDLLVADALFTAACAAAATGGLPQDLDAGRFANLLGEH